MNMTSKTPKKIGILFSLCVGLIGVPQLASAQLLHDDFSDGNFTSSPTWTVSAGNWSVSNGAVVSGGLASNDYLGTTDFTAINNGAFSVSVDVKFSSADVTGYNRLYLRMRDSTNGGAGYEVSIAQGTFNNTTVNVIGGATVGTITKASSANTFSTTRYVNITWTRDSSGVMTVSVNGQEYMSVASSSISSFDTFQIGGRGFIDATTSYTYSFDNVSISSIPEPSTAAIFAGGVGAIVAGLYRRR
jgi:hypothetical protein